MANEPSWDEIFNPRPAGDPAAPVPVATPTEWNPFEELATPTPPSAPAPEAYPPTAQYPASQAPAPAAYPAPPQYQAPQYEVPPAYQAPAYELPPVTPAPQYQAPPQYEAPAAYSPQQYPTPPQYPVQQAAPVTPQYEVPPASPAPQQYQAPQYQAPQYPDPQYPSPQYPDPQYSAPQYQEPPAYPAPQAAAPPQYEAPPAYPTPLPVQTPPYDVAPPAPVYRAPEPEMPAWPISDPSPTWPADPANAAAAAAWAAEPMAPAAPSWPAQPAAPSQQSWPQDPSAAPAPVWQPEVPAAPVSAWTVDPVAPVPLIEPAATADRTEDPFAAFADLFEPDAAAPVAAAPAATRELEPVEAAFPFAVAPAAASAAPAMADDPFAGLFGTAAPAGASAGATAFAADDRSGGGGFGGGSGRGDGRGGGGGGAPAPRRKRSLKWLAITLPIVIVLGLAGGGAAYAWFNYEDQVRELFGWELPNDYEGTGNGEEVIVTIQSGDLGSDVANTLHDAGVTMTFDSFYDLLLAQSENVNFIPGNYTLQKEMSAQSALDALLDPANKVTSRLLITEGTVLPSTLEIIAETTGIPLADVQAAAADPTVYGLAATEPSLEGWLFPATYELDGSETAEQILQMLVDEMISRLDALGVAPESRHEVLTKASIIQREAGSNQDDFYKIARVFQNRLDQGMNLQSDATVAYGTGNLQTVWTTDEERADASNLYNTYANPGLPIGPIGAPGELAIEAALAPADGPWLFFVPINLATGETVFSETADEHEAAVELLRAWCRESDENASYCE